MGGPPLTHRTQSIQNSEGLIVFDSNGEDTDSPEFPKPENRRNGKIVEFFSFIFFVVSGAESTSRPLLSYTPWPLNLSFNPSPNPLHPRLFQRLRPVSSPRTSQGRPLHRPPAAPIHPSPLGGVQADRVRRLEARQVATGRRPSPPNPPPLRPKGRLNPRQRVSGYARHSPASPPTPWTAGKTQ